MTPPPMPQTAAAVWVLTDEVVGHSNQSLGVAEALGLPFARQELAYGPAAIVPWALGPCSLIGLRGASRAALMPPWPAMVIAAGRRLGAVARWIKRRARADGQTTRLVQIMDPVRGRDAFDLIAAPRHDQMAARHNLIETIGAPNRITPTLLAAEGDAWRAQIAKLPAPRIAVMIGGATRRRGFAPELAADLGRLASAMAAARGGSLLAVTSRRTGGGATDALAAAVTVPNIIHRWDGGTARGDGGNPYIAFLGLADTVIVTGDSMSMCSEACATGKPVYIFAPPEIVKPAFARLHADLYRLGMARPLSAQSVMAGEPKPYEPLRAAGEIATQIRRRFGL